MTNVICGLAACNRTIAELDDSVTCSSGCKLRFHQSCTSVPKNSVKYINQCKNLLFVCDKCINVLHSPEVLNEKYNTILNLMNEILETVNSKDSELNKKIENLMNKQVTQKQIERKTVTLAEIIKTGSNSSVIIKPKNSEQKSDITKNDIKEKINPAEISVNGIRKVGKGAIVIECTDKKASDKLIKELNDNNLSGSYDIKETESKKPKLKIIGLSTKDEDSKIENYIKKQNGLENSDIKVIKVFENKQKNGFNCIIQVDGAAFQKLMEEKKIFVGWDRCRITESVDLLRCYNCSGFQHKATECKRIKSCPRCAESHDLKDCKTDKKECTNCKFAVNTYKMEIDLKHEAWSPECPTFLRRLSVQRSRISYVQ